MISLWALNAVRKKEGLEVLAAYFQRDISPDISDGEFNYAGKYGLVNIASSEQKWTVADQFGSVRSFKVGDHWYSTIGANCPLNAGTQLGQISIGGELLMYADGDETRIADEDRDRIREMRESRKHGKKFVIGARRDFPIQPFVVPYSKCKEAFLVLDYRLGPSEKAEQVVEKEISEEEDKEEEERRSREILEKTERNIQDMYKKLREGRSEELLTPKDRIERECCRRVYSGLCNSVREPFDQQLSASTHERERRERLRKWGGLIRKNKSVIRQEPEIRELFRFPEELEGLEVTGVDCYLGDHQ